MSNTTALTNAIAPRTCYCGCPRLVGKRSRFAPGHDAKFVSDQVLDLVDHGNYDGDIQDAIDTRAEAIKVNASPALANKFWNAAMNRWAKIVNEKSPRLQGSPAWVKVGRWVKQGTVTSITVDARGKETAGSEVCVITYTDAKGVEQSVQVDGGNHVQGKTWGLGIAK